MMLDVSCLWSELSAPRSSLVSVHISLCNSSDSIFSWCLWRRLQVSVSAPLSPRTWTPDSKCLNVWGRQSRPRPGGCPPAGGCQVSYKIYTLMSCFTKDQVQTTIAEDLWDTLNIYSNISLYMNNITTQVGSPSSQHLAHMSYSPLVSAHSSPAQRSDTGEWWPAPGVRETPRHRSRGQALGRQASAGEEWCETSENRIHVTVVKWLDVWHQDIITYILSEAHKSESL